jgi:hypothetical protein
MREGDGMTMKGRPSARPTGKRTSTVSWVIPLIGILVVASFPLLRYAERSSAEASAVQFLQQLTAAQQAFHQTYGGYAAEAISLALPCRGQTAAILSSEPLNTLGWIGYDWGLRPARGARVEGTDCHGRGVVSDYYASVKPTTPASAGRRAYAVTSTGRIFLFYDGIAPIEEDMRPGGLATRLEADATFKIP